ncbi:hypothetical protein MBAV_000427, partial [Candidatus Magnetobacterium bavaricum]
VEGKSLLFDVIDILQLGVGVGVGVDVGVDVGVGVGRLNVAVAPLDDNIVKRHNGLVPEQSPFQPVKTEPLSAVAVSSTLVAGGKEAEHVKPQFIDESELVTIPEPVPDLETTKFTKLPNRPERTGHT